MPISLYDASIPVFEHGLVALDLTLAKTVAFLGDVAISDDDLLGLRLHSTMLPLAYQIKSTLVHSVAAIRSLRTGAAAPDNSSLAGPISEWREKICVGLAELRSVSREEIDFHEEREVYFRAGDRVARFQQTDFLLNFSVPNFYFHHTAAYAILRMRGVPLGKSDFLPPVPWISA